MNILFKDLSPDLFSTWARMRFRFWEDNEEDCRQAYAHYEGRREKGEALTLLAFAGEDPIGFTEGELRTDYVEGADERPIWYLEGIYVEPHARRHGVATRLVRELARRVGAQTLASSTEVENERSRKFHKAMGFREVQQTINFILPIESDK